MAGRCVGLLCRRLCSSNAAPVVAEQAKPGFWERTKNRKFVVWTKHLLRDYAEACKDIVVGAKEQPGKAALYVSLLAGIGVCSSKAPTEQSFQCSMLDASSCLLLLSPWTRSGKSDQHVQRLTELSNQGRLRYTNFLIFSLMYEAPYDPECDLYNTQCPHLKPRWSDFPSRVLDIGFFGRWWLLQSKMEDCDINEDEFTHLPAQMKTISYNDLHSEYNEKLYESKFKAVVMPEDELDQNESEEKLDTAVIPEDELDQNESKEKFDTTVMPKDELDQNESKEKFKAAVMPEDELDQNESEEKFDAVVMPEDELDQNESKEKRDAVVMAEDHIEENEN